MAGEDRTVADAAVRGELATIAAVIASHLVKRPKT
jgi:hypothetical protein